MARDEDQAQQVVADVVFVERGERRGIGTFCVRELACEQFAFARQHVVAPKTVDRAALGNRHQPRAGIARDAFAGPLRERGDERILREFLSDADVAHHARQTGDELRRLDAPDRLERPLCVYWSKSSGS